MKMPFVLPIKTALGYYVYDANRNEIVRVSKQLYLYLINLTQIVEKSDPRKNFDMDESELASAEKDFNQLRECGYFLPSQIESVQHPLSEKIEILLDRAMGSLTLQVTQNCNLRCKYCVYSEESNNHQRSHSNNIMSFKTAKKALDFFRRHIADTKNAAVGFYGGEPLLAFPLIKKAVQYAENVFEGREIIFSITTNGTLLTDEIIQFLIKHKFKVTISIDGPESIQNQNRVFANGSGSYDVVLHNLKKYYRLDPNHLSGVALSMVIGSQTDYLSLLPLFDEPELKNVELLFSYVEENSEVLPPSNEYIAQYNSDFFLALINYFRKGDQSVLNPFMKTSVKDFSQNKEKVVTNILSPMTAPAGPCVPGKARLFVNCFGDFYPCEKVNENKYMRIGSLESGLDYAKIQSLLNVSSLSASRCKKCWAFSLCQVCAKGFDERNKNPELSIRICETSRKSAFHKIMCKIISYENDQHSRYMKKIKTGV